MVEGTPWLNVRTQALIDAAHATLMLGSLDRARAHAVEALRLCEAKDDIALAVHVRALLERTDAPGAASA